MRGVTRALRERPILWLLGAVPSVFVVERAAPEQSTVLFLLSILAIVPLATLLSSATESVAARTGDAVGGLLNATLGNLTELVIALTALRAGMFALVKASVIGAIVTNSLFMMGMALLLGGLRHHVQEYNRATARLQAGMLFMATVAMTIPSFIGASDRPDAQLVAQQISVGLAVLLLVAYVLGLVFSLHTHKTLFASTAHEGEGGQEVWPIRFALGVLAGVTLLVALVSEIFVESVQQAAQAFGMSQAFVGFIVVSLVGAAAEMTTAFAAARKNRVDLSVGVALGSSSQIALFVAPVLVLASLWIAPAPMDMTFGAGAVVAVLVSTLAVTFVTNSGKSAWYLGVQLLVLYFAFAIALYLVPPAIR